MKPYNITSWLLIIAQLSKSNKSTAQQHRFKLCDISLTFWYINHKKIKGKECVYVTTINYFITALFIIHIN